LFRVLPDLQPLLLPVGTDLPWVTRQAIKLSNVLHSVAQLRDFIIWLMAAFFLVACLSHLLWGLCGTQSVWEQVALQVEKGRLLADAASEVRAIPPLYVSLLRVGERRGTLAGSLTMASGLFQQRAEYRLQRLDTLIGPVLVLSVGALMVAVIVWILLPAYDAISSYGVIV